MITQGPSLGVTLQLDSSDLSLLMDPSCASTSSDDLTNGFSRFLLNAFPHVAPVPSQPALRSVIVCLENPTALLQLGVNESYSLALDVSGIRLNCSTVYGCYHGLETLSQLVLFDYEQSGYFIHETPIVVVDTPRFPHRGLMLDSSRFLPVPLILQALDSMTYAKLNTFHWHMVDSQSFPFVSAQYPQLAAAGAYSVDEQYSPDDVRQVVEYARARGIRAVIELDTPGHTGAMCSGMPELCPSPLCQSTEINSWALDITKNATFDTVEGLLSELAGLFPDQFLHIGGDELDTTCWSQHPYIVDWFKAQGMGLDDGYVYYGRRIHRFVNTMLNRTIIGWQEMYEGFFTQLNPDTTVVQQWIPTNGWGTFDPNLAFTKNVTSHGYRLIWSDAAKWYLDFLQVTWGDMYEAEPCDGLTADECMLVIGGEGCMWGETVDASDLMQTIWPRAAGIAERLWSPRSSATASSANATDRLVAFRCLLNRRGIAGAPPENILARHAPYDASSCFYQFSASSEDQSSSSTVLSGPPVTEYRTEPSVVVGAAVGGLAVGAIAAFFFTSKRRHAVGDTINLV